MSKLKIDAWIKAGYKLLGKEGVDGVKVERLARILQLNKSGFYHYFGSMKIYLKSLLEYHVEMAKVIAPEIAACQNLDPDLLLLMIKHKGFFLVESQLLLKSKSAYFSAEADEAGKIINKELLPLWRKDTQLPEDSAVALSYLNIILHFFYARINSENLSYQYLHALTFETEAVLNKVMDEKHVSSHKMERRTSTE
jgi:AcrR family transcriptional regulator